MYETIWKETVEMIRTHEMLKNELEMILNSYEDVIIKVGDEISIKTINRYFDLVMRQFPEPLIRYRFLKDRLDVLIKNIINNERSSIWTKRRKITKPIWKECLRL